jgi:hypothetical protein
MQLKLPGRLACDPGAVSEEFEGRAPIERDALRGRQLGEPRERVRGSVVVERRASCSQWSRSPGALMPLCGTKAP